MRFKGTLAAFCVAGIVTGLVQGTAAADVADVDGITGTVQRDVVDVVHEEHEEHEEHGEQQIEGTYLRTADGDLVQVPTSDLEGVEIGATVTVRLGRAVRATSADPAAQVEAGRAVLEHRVVAAPRQMKAASTAVRKVLPVSVTFSGAPVGPTANQLRTLVGQVNSYYSRVTRNAITYTSLAPAITAVDRGLLASCDLGKLEQTVRAQVAVPADATLLMHTPAMGCSFSGRAWLGDPERRGLALWVQNTLNPMVVAHEIGHNLGLGHSASAACRGADDATDLARCSPQGYGDFFDIMGSGARKNGELQLVEMNAPQRDRLGAFASGQLRAVDPAANTSTALVPIGSSNGVQALKFATGGATYYVELRAGGGHDSTLYPAQYFGTTDSGAQGWASVPTGVTVRRLDRDVRGASPYLLEPKAAGRAFVLAAGQSFTTADRAVTITTTAVSGRAATVRVASTAATAVPGAPTAVDVQPGLKNVRVSIAIADTGSNPLTGYRMTLYSGGKVLSTRALNLTGTSASVTVTGLVPGRSYVFGVSAANKNGYGAETRSRAVVPVDVPARVTGVKATRSGNSLAVTWTTPASNGTPITGYVVKAYRDGKLVTTQRGTGNRTSVPVTPGTWSVVVAAVNAAGTGSDSTRVDVKVPTR